MEILASPKTMLQPLCPPCNFRENCLFALCVDSRVSGYPGLPDMNTKQGELQQLKHLNVLDQLRLHNTQPEHPCPLSERPHDSGVLKHAEI